MGSNKFTGKNVPCIQCEKLHYRPINRLHNPNQFCSYECFTIFRTGRKTRPWSEEVKRKIGKANSDLLTHIHTDCDFCGKIFMRHQSQFKKKKFCSTECFIKSAVGRKKHKQGYWLLKIKDHPHRNSSGYVFEHRIAAEKIIGRFLNPEETIHHINETKDDNRPENLYLFSTPGEHTAYHHAVTRGARLPITESNLKSLKIKD